MPSRLPTRASDSHVFPVSARSSKTTFTARSRSSAGCAIRDAISLNFPRGHGHHHPLSAVPHPVAFGVTRTVAAKIPMVAFEGGQYSVPWTLPGQPVWVRAHGTGEDEQVIAVHVGEGRPGRGRPP